MSATTGSGAPRRGGRFCNPSLPVPATAPARGLLPILRWRFGRNPDRVAWPETVTDPPPAGDPAAPVPDGAVGVTFIGHSTFLLRVPLPGGRQLDILTDPIFSARCSPVSWAGPKRARPPGRALDALPLPDLVLVSHNHYDHMDLPSLRALCRRAEAANRPLRVVAPLGNARHLRKAGIAEATELDWWQDTMVAGARVVATPARHFSARTPRDRNRSLWSGFLVEAGGHRILFAGDSGQGPHWNEIRQRLGAPDLALLPIGAYEPRFLMAPVHMDPDEAMAAHQALGARRSVGMHFGTFRLTDEAIDAPVERLAAARPAVGMPRERFDTLGFGETRHVALGG